MAHSSLQELVLALAQFPSSFSSLLAPSSLCLLAAISDAPSVPYHPITAPIVFSSVALPV
jgi:hypothetical protein